MSQPITLYGHRGGPNPWKVAIILEELKVPYINKFMGLNIKSAFNILDKVNIPNGLEMADLKKEPFETINPNGRVPAITDPNTDVTLWESGAIIEYLIDTYDHTAALTYTSSPERYQVKQWLHFQMSGQGPYYGQAAWFTKFHAEKIDSAIERYLEQIKRVLYVLDKHLNGKEWLVGDKCTFADLSFVPWDMAIPWIFGDRVGELEIEKNYPHYFAWNKRLMERPSVQKIVKDKAAATSGH